MPLAHVSLIANVAVGYVIPSFARRFDPFKPTNRNQDVRPFSILLVGLFINVLNVIPRHAVTSPHPLFYGWL